MMMSGEQSRGAGQLASNLPALLCTLQHFVKATTTTAAGRAHLAPRGEGEAVDTDGYEDRISRGEATLRSGSRAVGLRR
eukprot:NODE_2204_length_447_cov_105.934673_g2124_i0.p1 GENE.NODE_2204_length_447_cov_105.934673_g2124_i0~~NODE_2204_length_447_cov_105.934673_g2124_i0.p1  ORF type:complete len:79 (-),score=1.55 NODE_2204_length_447_cov_105.934673_g2124_i0:64-300(-)